MLVLSRKPKEKIVLPTIGAAIQVLEIKRGAVRLGIDAPPEVQVLRAEVPNRAAEWGPRVPRNAAPALEGKHDELLQQLHDRLRATAAALGLARFQLDAGRTADAGTTLAALHEHLQITLHGVAGEQQPPSTSVTAARRSALVVEDDGNERELLAGFLRQSGLDVATAGDGADALSYLREHGKPDVVLLDMGLPRIDGATMVREVRRQSAYAGLKIFGVSGHLPEEFDLEQGPAGIDGWFQKPIDPTALLHHLAEELESSLCTNSSA